MLYACFDDLPIGTKLVSLANPETIGEVVAHEECRGMFQVTIQWSNGNTSIAWIHEITNKKH